MRLWSISLARLLTELGINNPPPPAPLLHLTTDSKVRLPPEMTPTSYKQHVPSLPTLRYTGCVVSRIPVIAEGCFPDSHGRYCGPHGPSLSYVPNLVSVNPYCLHRYRVGIRSQ